MQKYLLGIVCHFFILALNAQSTFIIKGQVIDNEKEPLIAATVIALTPQDSIMAGFGVTDMNGSFEVKNLQAGTYILQITYIGFGTFENAIEVGGESKTIELGTIALSSGVNQLDEIIVKGEFIPLNVRKDTVEYNADAFKVRPNANVEELLKQLPGIEVESDGSIKAQGETVQSVTVDGKKFFGNDPKVATKNIPANAVKKVQVFDQKSDRAAFSGVDDGNTTKTINLELKNNRSVGLFGNIEAGYGTDERYMAKASVNKFDGKYQIAGLFLLNNINQDGFSPEEMSLFSGNNGGFRFRGGNNGPSFTNGATQNIAGGLNFSYIPNKKWTITGSYFNTYKDVLELQDTYTENTLGNRTIIEQNEQQSMTQQLTHKFSFDVDALIDSTSRLDLDVNFTTSDNEGNYLSTAALLTEEQVPTTNTNQNLFGNEKRNTLRGSGEYNKKIGQKGQILTLNTSINDVLNKDSTYLNQAINRVNNNTLLTLQDQLSRTDNATYTFGVNFKQPLGNRNFLDFSAERSNFNSERLKNFLDYDPDVPNVRSLNDSLSTLVNNDVVYTRGGLEYTIDKEAYTVSFGGKYNQSIVRGSIPMQDNIENKYNYFLPSFSLSFEEVRIRFTYRTSVNEPSANQLQSVVDNSNPARLYVGNPDLQPEYNHSFNLRYSFFNRFNLNGLFAFVNYRYTTNPIINAQQILPDLTRITSPINVDNGQNLSFSLFYNTPIRPLKLKTTLRMGTNLNKNINLINSIANNVTTFSPNVGLRFENTNNNTVSLSVGGAWAYSQNTFSINTDQNSNFLNHTYDARLLVNLPKNWYLDADYTMQLFTSAAFTENANIQLLNGSISKAIMNNRLEFKLRAFDILNQNKGFSQSIGDTYIEQSTINTIQRYFMFSVLYKLSGFGG